MTAHDSDAGRTLRALRLAVAMLLPSSGPIADAVLLDVLDGLTKLERARGSRPS